MILVVCPLAKRQHYGAVSSFLEKRDSQLEIKNNIIGLRSMGCS